MGMLHVDFCILGAGPSGLTFAHKLLQAGCTSFVLLEKEAEAGGLCRSTMVDGAPLAMRVINCWAAKHGIFRLFPRLG
jgi:cation diffusion facilitator CzcD-associated flavoprotein CzcO